MDKSKTRPWLPNCSYQTMRKALSQAGCSANAGIPELTIRTGRLVLLICAAAADLCGTAWREPLVLICAAGADLCRWR
jgi:hypothetical protein